jgi:MraZ protein
MPAQPKTKPIFSGEFRHSVDDKNRVTIPARWRAGKADEFFVVPDEINHCLLVMPPEMFEKVSETVMSHTEISSKEKRIFVRQFYSRAHNSTADGQGRLLLPDDHCKQVGIRKDVVLVGSLQRFEIWSPEQWKKFQASGKPTYQKVADLVGL